MQKNKNVFLVCSILLTVFLISSHLYAQQKIKGDMQERKQSILNSNETSILVTNYGSIGKPNYLAGIVDFVWRGLGYLYEFGPLAGAKVVNENGDTLFIVDDSFILTAHGDYSPDGLKKWGWLPRVGFSNPNSSEVPTANNMSSWVPSWSAWNGELGYGTTLGNNEAYYVMDDFTNREFDYYPFPEDSTKRGLGLKSEVRIYQFDNYLKNAVLVKYFLTNESSKNLDEVYFGFFGDPHIGGWNNYTDDRIKAINLPDNLLTQNNLSVSLWDDDMTGDGGLPAGILNFRFLETPGDQGMTSLRTGLYGSVFPIEDEVMRLWFTGGIDTTSEYFSNPGDNIVFFGTGSFPLNAGETKTISIIISASENFQYSNNEAKLFPFYYYLPDAGISLGSSGGNENYHINLLSPLSGTLNGSFPVQWNYSGNIPNAHVLIDCSSDNGKNWKYVGDAPASAGSVNWNTAGYKDGVNYLLRVTAFNPDSVYKYYYSLSNSLITINNPVNAQPEAEFNLNFTGTTLTNPSAEINWKAEDADNSDLNVTISYAVNRNGPWHQIVSNTFSAGVSAYNWNLVNIPSMAECFLKLTASDGLLDTTIYSEQFAVDFKIASFPASNIQHLKGRSTSRFFIQVVDSSQLKNDTYDLSFYQHDTLTYINIKSINTGLPLVSDFPILEGYSTPVFDGIKLSINNIHTSINLDKTGFNRKELEGTYNIKFPPAAGNPKVKEDNDWIVVFNDMETSAGGSYLFPADTAITNLGFVKVITPFKIFNTTYNSPGNYVVIVSTATTNLSPWKTNQPVILRPNFLTGSITTYQINFTFSDTVKPHLGDTLFIITHKALTGNDNYRFSVNPDVVLPVEKENMPDEFMLHQNYPNPFNPVTTIKFSIPGSKENLSKVNLKIYDVLGREVTELVNEMKPAGTYEIKFDASDFSSGVYFYRLESGGYLSVKKMLLLK